MTLPSPLKHVDLPDFRNLGVLMRVVVLAESLNFLSALAQASGLGEMLAIVAGRSAFFEPALLVALLGLFFLSTRLAALPYRFGVWAVLGLSLAATLGWQAVYSLTAREAIIPSWGRAAFFALVVAGVILFYFNWRYRVLSPAIVEARLMALQARIRPHFLFNSLNTVLGLMRQDPRRSETVLENLADLFRALLAEARALVPLAKELELARAYMEIESIRLGPRLQVHWQVADAPLGALVPPLVLQPLIENAVYHGIERTDGGGTLSVVIFEKDDVLNMIVRNPCNSEEERRPGNRMALSNIRERLALHYDADAQMSAFRAGEDYVVQIRVPCRYGTPGKNHVGAA
jgi:two-component system sensor histidine kinase AlgZ